MRNVEIFNELYKKSGWFCFRGRDIHPVFCPCHRHIKQSPLFCKGHTIVLICNELNNRIIFDLAREPEFSFEHIDQNYVVIPKALGTMRCHKGDLCIWVFFTPDRTARQFAEPIRSVQLIHVIIVSSNQQNRTLLAVLR